MTSLLNVFDPKKGTITASQMIKILKKLEPDTLLRTERGADTVNFKPLLLVALDYELTKPEIVTIEEFDLAYRKYFLDTVENYISVSMSFPEEQYNSCIEHYGNQEVGGYLLFVTRIEYDPNVGHKIKVEKILVSRDGKVEVPEYLNDYI